MRVVRLPGAVVVGALVLAGFVVPVAVGASQPSGAARPANLAPPGKKTTPPGKTTTTSATSTTTSASTTTATLTTTVPTTTTTPLATTEPATTTDPTPTSTTEPATSTTSETVTPTTSATTTAPSRTMPLVPHMTLAALLARYPGATFPEACRKLNTYAVIDLPDGFAEQLIGFTDINQMALYCPYVLGFAGNGTPSLTMKPDSATNQANVISLRQAQGIDDNQTTGLRPYPTVNTGWTFNGSNQMLVRTPPDQGGRLEPMLYGGIINYIGRASYWTDLKVTGFPGDWYYPPGETMQISDYRTVDAYYARLEVDGRIAAGLPGAGERVGGAPFGSSGSRNVTIEDSYFHDSRASSLTFSFAGSEETGQNTDTVTVRRTRVEGNANHDTVSGRRFTGINFEGVKGQVLLDHVTVILDNPTLWWDASHMSVNSAVADNPNYLILEPTWNPLATWTNGAFVVEMPFNYSTGQKQTTPPRVVKDGVELAPFVYRGTPPDGYIAPVDPARQFVVFTR